ncbi:hypothetical protein ON010_g12891 [Phytophthora cinnamomi]|nr:hypothetical protein ON010_g12891 [Phytophthora cinnamomi]
MRPADSPQARGGGLPSVCSDGSSTRSLGHCTSANIPPKAVGFWARTAIFDVTSGLVGVQARRGGGWLQQGCGAAKPTPAMNSSDQGVRSKDGASPGIEPGTSRTRSENHTTRPRGHSKQT